MKVAVVGGGIVGLATAYELLRRGFSVTLFEKEPAVAAHQTGHNSGVIHSGVYYKPGSAKARLSVRGGALLRQFCDDNGVPWRECGKLIVARNADELPMLDELHRRGTANGVPRLSLLDEFRDIEPNAAGIRALHVPTAAIVDYGAVSRALAQRIEALGGQIRLGVRVTSAPEGFDRVVFCAGLHADRLARSLMSSAARHPLRRGIPRSARNDTDMKIVPFRGEYYSVKRPDLVRGLLYPVPDPRFPFLGVHFTRTIGGGLQAGPNAVLALAREGYRWRDVNVRDLFETLTYPGFWRLIAPVRRTVAGEVRRSLSKRAFARALQSLVPAIQVDDLVPAPAGVRAQALARDGALVDDFAFVKKDGALHVLNAPSPAATASLAIAEEIADALQ
jgi:L-2-hydroxyglutarate oxidase LhgO